MDASRLSFDANNTPWVAVSLQRTGECTLHAGILYKTAALKVSHLHFAWHRRLIDGDASGPIACCIPPLDDAEAEFLSGFCTKIAKLAPQNNIPYNLKYDEAVLFDGDTGAISFGPDSTGLGCATFVLAVFRSAKLPIVDADGWPPPSDEDKKVRRGHIAALAGSRDPGTRQQAVKIANEIDSPRIRPDHVAGACLESERGEKGAKHAECEANGVEVVRRMDVHFASPAPTPAP